MSVSEKIIIGVLMGNFVLVSSSIIVGFFSDYLIELFEIFTLVSVLILFLFLFYSLKEKKWHLFSDIKFTHFKFKAYLALLLVFALFGLFLHTIYLEYDAIYTYFPYAKSIALTGSMNYNVYAQSTLSTGMPPLLPVIYAWAFTTANDLNSIGIQNDMGLPDLLRPIPATYFLLTALVIYLIAREMSQKEYASLSVIIFVSFPITILTLSAFASYLDLGFVFYLLSAVLCCIRAMRTRKPLWFFLVGVASSLLLLAKELSIFVIPLIFSVLILFSSIKYRRIIFVILSTLPFNLIFIWDSFGFPIEGIILRQIPVLILSVLLYYLSNAFKRPIGIFTWKNLVLFIIPFIPSSVFLLRGLVNLGSIYSMWGPGLSYPNYLFRMAMDTSQKSLEVINFFRWDIPFLSLGLGVSYLIPLLLSIVILFKRKQQGDNLVNLLLIMVLLTLLETMAFTLVGSQAESRRMYYFAPILAILAANGLMIFDRFVKNKYSVYLCILFNSVVVSYIWIYRYPFQTLLSLSYLKTSFSFASIFDLAFLMLTFASVFLILPFVQKKLWIEMPKNPKVNIQNRKGVLAKPPNLTNARLNFYEKNEVRGSRQRRSPIPTVEQEKYVPAIIRSQKWRVRIRFHMKRKIIYIPLIALSCLLVIYPTVPLWLQGVDRGFDFFSLQHDVYEPTYENGILIVGYYFMDHVDDHYVTVSFGGDALRYFANRSVINLANVGGVQSVQNILPIEVPEDLLAALNNSNIGYFLIPRSNNSFYPLYLGFQKNFYFFRFLEEDSHFSLVKEFDYYRLVRFQHSST